MLNTIKIGEFLHRKKVPVSIQSDEDYDLVTVKLHHNGVVLRERKKGFLLGSNMYRISKGDFILSGIDARNGAFGVVPVELDGAVVTNDFWYFDVDESKVKRDFFYWLTTTPLFLDACQKSSKGETQRIRLQKDLFYDFEFHFPPVEQQEAFLKRFSNIDVSLTRLNVENTAQSQLLKQLRQAILQEAVEGKLTADWRASTALSLRRSGKSAKDDPEYDSKALLEKIKVEKEKLIKEGKIRKEKPLAPIKDDEKPFALPEGWVWCRLGEVIDLISGQHIEATQCNSNKRGNPYITGPADFGMFNPIVSKWTEFPKVTSIKNDILITVKGSGVGKINLNNIDGLVISRQLMAIRNILCDSTFLFTFVGTMNTALQDAKDGLIPGITREHIRDHIFTLPPLAEQRAIVSRVDSLLSTLSSLESQITERQTQSEQLMQAVLCEAFEVAA